MKAIVVLVRVGIYVSELPIKDEIYELEAFFSSSSSRLPLGRIFYNLLYSSLSVLFRFLRVVKYADSRVL